MKNKAFENIKKMNVAFGNPEGDINNPNWGVLETQAKCIPEEVDELLEAIKNKDMIQVRDAVGDIIVFAVGVAHKAGFDADADLDAIYSSNMTKFIKDDETLAKTIEKYAKIGVNVNVAGEYPTKYVYSNKDQMDVGGKFYPKGKFLKSVDFVEPKLV